MKYRRTSHDRKVVYPSEFAQSGKSLENVLEEITIIDLQGHLKQRRAIDWIEKCTKLGNRYYREMILGGAISYVVIQYL